MKAVMTAMKIGSSVSLWQQLAKQYDVPECMMYKLNLHEWKDALVA